MSFRHLCNAGLNIDIFDSTKCSMVEFLIVLESVADDCIPGAATNTGFSGDEPWFGDDCKGAVRLRRAALGRFNTNPSHANLQHFRIVRAGARRTMKHARGGSWQGYVSKLGGGTSIRLEHDWRNERRGVQGQTWPFEEDK